MPNCFAVCATSFPYSKKTFAAVKRSGLRISLHSRYWTSSSGLPSLYWPCLKSAIREDWDGPVAMVAPPSSREPTSKTAKGIDQGGQQDGNDHRQQQQREADFDIIAESIATRLHDQHIHCGRHRSHEGGAAAERNRYRKGMRRDM